MFEKYETIIDQFIEDFKALTGMYKHEPRPIGFHVRYVTENEMLPVEYYEDFFKEITFKPELRKDLDNGFLAAKPCIQFTEYENELFIRFSVGFEILSNEPVQEISNSIFDCLSVTHSLETKHISAIFKNIISEFVQNNAEIFKAETTDELKPFIKDNDVIPF